MITSQSEATLMVATRLLVVVVEPKSWILHQTTQKLDASANIPSSMSSCTPWDSIICNLHMSATILLRSFGQISKQELRTIFQSMRQLGLPTLMSCTIMDRKFTLFLMLTLTNNKSILQSYALFKNCFLYKRPGHNR